MLEDVSMLMESIKETVETTLESHDIEKHNGLDDVREINRESLEVHFDCNSFRSLAGSDANDTAMKNGTVKEVRYDKEKMSESTMIVDNSFDQDETVSSEILENDGPRPAKVPRRTLHSIPELPMRGGSIMTLGEDSSGELGLSKTGILRKRPTLVEGITEEIVQIAVGAMHNVLLTQKGHVLSFGCNDELALGRDTSASSDVPLEAQPLREYLLVILACV